MKYEIDDGGVPNNDAAALFFLSEGRDAAGNVPQGKPRSLPPKILETLKQGKPFAGIPRNSLRREHNGDLMAGGPLKRDYTESDADLHMLVHADRHDEDVASATAMLCELARADGEDFATLHGAELAVEAILKREREYIARRDWIDTLCQPVASPQARLRRVQNGLKRLQHARSRDTRAIIAAIVHDDMMELPEISDKHRLDCIAYALTTRDDDERDDRDNGKCTRTALNFVRRGRLLIEDLKRHALPELAVSREPSAAEMRAAYSKIKRQAARGGKPKLSKAEIEARVKQSLHSTSAIDAIDELSGRDQRAVMEIIEREILSAESEATERADAKQGYATLTCMEVENLEFAGRLNGSVCRQLAKKEKAERSETICGFVMERLGRTDEETGRKQLVKYFKMAKRERESDGQEIGRIISQGRRDAEAGKTRCVTNRQDKPKRVKETA